MRTKALSIQPEDLADIQYIGISGSSQVCLDAMRRLIQCGDKIEQALIVTFGQLHAFLLKIQDEQQIAVKSGFTSGYQGQGPSALADALLLIQTVGAEVDEICVSDEIFTRLDLGVLTDKDLKVIEITSLIQPRRWYDYVYDIRGASQNDRDARKNFRPIMPWSIIDDRIIDLANDFFRAPSDSLLRGFRRLEDCVRSRTDLEENGVKLFSQAFATDESVLQWEVQDSSEQKGRAQLFVGAFMAYRNPHAHRETIEESGTLLLEFLLLNHLFVLERSSITRTNRIVDKTKVPSRTEPREIPLQAEGLR